MSTFDRLPELAARLDGLVPPEVGSGNWDDVLRRARPLARTGRAFTLRLAIAAALFLLLAGVATATYLVLEPRPSTVPAKPGALTLAVGNYGDPTEIAGVLPNGRLVIVWRCPRNVFSCGELTSVDWAPDGRHLAFTLDAIHAATTYLGLHILDLDTGRDIHFAYRGDRRLGCGGPSQVAWSPDSRTLAFGCWDGIHTIRSDGTGAQRLPTGLPAGSPSWSPDGEKIAFVGTAPGETFTSIYVMRLDGSSPVRIAQGGALSPDWSPDGKTIVYRAPDGIRFATPDGVDVTPPGPRGPHTSLAPRGVPTWSPDGSTIAIGTLRGIYLLPASGGRAKLATRTGTTSAFGTTRPAWYPGVRPPRRIPSTPPCSDC